MGTTTLDLGPQTAEVARVVAGVRDDISVQDVFRGVTPFFVADALTIMALIAAPSIVLWLPRLAS